METPQSAPRGWFKVASAMNSKEFHGLVGYCGFGEFYAKESTNIE
jgi:hypothetical protein